VHCNTIGDCFYSHPEEVENLTPIDSANTINPGIVEPGAIRKAFNKVTGNDDQVDVGNAKDNDEVSINENPDNINKKAAN